MQTTTPISNYKRYNVKDLLPIFCKHYNYKYVETLPIIQHYFWQLSKDLRNHTGYVRIKIPKLGFFYMSLWNVNRYKKIVKKLNDDDALKVLDNAEYLIKEQIQKKYEHCKKYKENLEKQIKDWSGFDESYL